MVIGSSWAAWAALSAFSVTTVKAKSPVWIIYTDAALQQRLNGAIPFCILLYASH